MTPCWVCHGPSSGIPLREHRRAPGARYLIDWPVAASILWTYSLHMDSFLPLIEDSSHRSLALRITRLEPCASAELFVGCTSCSRGQDIVLQLHRMTKLEECWSSCRNVTAGAKTKMGSGRGNACTFESFYFDAGNRPKKDIFLRSVLVAIKVSQCFGMCWIHVMSWCGG